MSKQSLSLYSLALAASGAIAEARFVTPAGAQAGAGVNTLGVSQFEAADTETVTVSVIGTAIVETGGAVAAGGLVESDASGRAIAKATGVAAARALPGQSSAGAGEFIEVLLIAN
jgi:hypothetical protein